MKIYARMIDQSVYEKRIKEVEETDNAIEVIEEDGSFVILPIRNIIYCKLQKEEEKWNHQKWLVLEITWKVLEKK